MPQRHAGFARKTPKTRRAKAGRTRISETPLDIRVSGIHLPDGFGPARPSAARAAARPLRDAHRARDGSFRGHQRASGRRRHGLSNPAHGERAPAVLVQRNAVDAQTALSALGDRGRGRDGPVGESGGEADARAAARRAALVRRSLGDERLEARAMAEDGSLVGRRVGRARANVERAASRPEKQRRDVFIDTAAPGVSETDRKAGGGSSAARNTKLRRRRMGYALEDSAAKPSRKSTRKSANRAKSGSKLARRQRRKVRSPKARATRAKIQRQRGTRMRA